MPITSNSVLPPLPTLTPMLTSVLTPYLKSAIVLNFVAVEQDVVFLEDSLEEPKFGSSGVAGSRQIAAKNSATSRKVMHRHHFACSQPRSRSREPAETRCRP